MTREELMPIFLEEVAKGGSYFVVKRRLLDRLTEGKKLTPTNLRDHIQLINEAQLLLHARGQLEVEHFSKMVHLVVVDQDATHRNTTTNSPSTDNQQ